LLVRVDLEIPDTKESAWMVVHTDIRRNARVRAFADFVYDRLVLHRGLFDPA